MSKADYIRAVLERHPNPPADNPVDRLRHTLDFYRDEDGSLKEPGRVVLLGTSGIYGDGVQTAVTMTDLDTLLKLVEEHLDS